MTENDVDGEIDATQDECRAEIVQQVGKTFRLNIGSHFLLFICPLYLNFLCRIARIEPGTILATVGETGLKRRSEITAVCQRNQNGDPRSPSPKKNL
jgi:hypothetical protein